MAREGAGELLDGFGGRGRAHLGEDVDGQEDTDGLLERAEHDPSGARHHHGRPPGAPVLRGPGRHEAQIVDLFADLRDQRQTHARAQQHRGGVDPAVAVGALVREEGVHRSGVGGDQIEQRSHHQQQPDRGRPDLKLAQRLHPEDDQGNHHAGRQHIAQPQGQPEAQFQALRHDRAFEGEEDEGEAGEDDAGQDRAVVAEARTPGDEVQVDVVARRVVGEGEAGDEDDHRGEEDRGQCVPGAVCQADARTDREVGHVRDAAQRGGRHDHRCPTAVAARGEPEGVVLQGLVGGFADGCLGGRGPMAAVGDCQLWLDAHAGSPEGAVGTRRPCTPTAGAAVSRVRAWASGSAVMRTRGTGPVRCGAGPTRSGPVSMAGQ